MNATTATVPVADVNPNLRIALRGTRAAIYARISSDRIGAGLGVARQTEDSLLAAADYGLTVDPGNVFSDNDLSGYKATKPRPGFEDLCQSIRDGEVDVVLCWHIDRLTRRLSQLAEFVELCQRHGVKIISRMAGQIDPNDPAAVMHVQIMGSLAEYESALKSARGKAKHEELAKAGKAHGGRRAFGFNMDGTHRPDEAAVVREVAARLLNGETLYSVSADLRRREVPTVRGGKWTGPNLRSMILKPIYAGHRVHNGEVIGRSEWAPILTEADHAALVHRLENPARRTTPGSARRHLLTGVAFCGKCGARLGSKSTGTRGNGRKNYACRQIDCGGVNRHTVPVDAMVEAFVLARLEKIDANGLLSTENAATEAAQIRADLDALAHRRAELGGMVATGTLSPAAFAAATTALDAEEGRLNVALDAAGEAAAAPQRVLKGLTGPNPAEVFTSLPLGRQRAVIDILCTITIHPGRGGNGFRPELVTITPKEG